MNIAKLIEQGENYIKKKNYDAAIAVFMQAAHIKPNNRKAREGLRTAQLRKHEASYPNAIVVAIVGLPARIGMFFAGLGKKGHPEGFMEACEKYLALDPRNKKVNTALGDAAAGAGHLEAAIVAYKTAAEFNPDDVTALKRLAGLYHKTGELKKAHQTYKKIVDLSPKDQEAIKSMRNVAAETSLQETGFETAKSSQDLVKDKDALSSLEAETRMYRTADDLEAREKSLEEKLVGAPENTELLQQLADVQKKLKKWDEALATMDRAREVKPDDIVLQFARDDLEVEKIEDEILTLQRDGKVDEANARKEELVKTQTEAFRHRVKAYPTDLKLRFKLGELLFLLNKMDEAIHEFQQTVRDPRYKSDSQLRLGAAFASKGQHELAERQLLGAMDGQAGMNDRMKEIYYTLGEVYESWQKPDKAKEAYSKIYEVDIGYGDVADRLAKLDA